MTKWKEQIDRELGASKWNDALEQKILSRQKKRFHWQYPAVLAAIVCVLVILFLTNGTEPVEKIHMAAQPLEQVMEESKVSHFYVSKLGGSSYEFTVRDSEHFVGTVRRDEAKEMQRILDNLVLSDNWNTTDDARDVIVEMENGQQLKLKFFVTYYDYFLVEDIQTKLHYKVENVSVAEVKALFPEIANTRMGINLGALILIALFILIEVVFYRWKQPAKKVIIFYNLIPLIMVWAQVGRVYITSEIPHVSIYYTSFILFLAYQFGILYVLKEGRKAYIVESIKALCFIGFFVTLLNWV